MSNTIRFGDFVREITIQQKQLSYNELTPEVSKDAEGKELPYKPEKLEIRSVDVYHISYCYV